MNFAAIDIGSNAVRLLVMYVVETDEDEPFFEKLTLVRVPIRLGEDTFLSGRISDRKADKLLKSMDAYSNLIDVYDVKAYRACATSAMRDAENGSAIAADIYEKTGVKIDIINGDEEAEIISHNRDFQKVIHNRAYLYIDIGGGSTELSLFRNGVKINAKSFNIGTVRLLHNQVTENDWNELKVWVNHNCSPYPNLSVVGSGGSINKMHKILGTKKGKTFSAEKLIALDDEIKLLSLRDRTVKYDLKPDRADVIPHATGLLRTIMTAGDFKRITVPKVGVADGVIKMLYEQHKNATSE